MKGWRHDIDVQLGKEKTTLPFLFLDNDLAPRLLGRAELFEHNMVVFEEKRRRSGIIDAASKEARAISRILDNSFH